MNPLVRCQKNQKLCDELLVEKRAGLPTNLIKMSVLTSAGNALSKSHHYAFPVAMSHNGSCHDLVHMGKITVSGQAPHRLIWGNGRGKMHTA